MEIATLALRCPIDIFKFRVRLYELPVGIKLFEIVSTAGATLTIFGDVVFVFFDSLIK